MSRPIIIKEGPFVFLRNVLVMELIAFVFFYVVALLGHYELIYRAFSISHYVPFQAFLISCISFFQLLYLSLLFLDWYFSHYEIHEREIIHKSGLLFRRKRRVGIADIVTIEVYQSPFSRLIYHATLILEHQTGRVTKLKNISHFNEHLHYIQQLLPNSKYRRSNEHVNDLVKQDEDQYLEFKETLRHDARNGSSSKDLERAVIKTIVGFMNADGGVLIIGVHDSGDVKGIERDYNTLPRKDRDGFEQHLNMLIKTMVGLPFAKYINTTFEKITDTQGVEHDVCIVRVKESHKPAYLLGGARQEEFYVRVGNTTQPFSMSEAEDYIKTHWK